VKSARSGQALRGAKVTFTQDGSVLRKPDSKRNLWLKPAAIITDDDGTARSRACVTDQANDRDALLREAGWVPGPDGVRVRASAADHWPLVDSMSRLEFSQTPQGGIVVHLRPPHEAIATESAEAGLPRLEGRLEFSQTPQGGIVVHLVPIEAAPEGPDFGIGVDGGVDSFDSLDPSRIEDTSRFILNGRQEDQTSNTVPNGQHSGLFGNSSKATSFGPYVVFNLGLFGSEPSKALGPGTAGPPASRASARRAITSFTAGIARSEEELEYDKIDDGTPGGRDTTWNGSGTVVRVGVAQSFRFGRGLVLRLGYRHERLLETDVTRSPGLQATGGRLLRDQGRLSRQTHVVRANLGWSGRYLSPWAGVRLSWETLRLTGEAAAEFDIPQGMLEQQISFVNEFKTNRVLADFGLDVRIPRTRVFLRAQGATNGSDVRFGVSASHGWFRGR